MAKALCFIGHAVVGEIRTQRAGLISAVVLVLVDVDLGNVSVHCVLSAVPFAIESVSDFKYMYISFLGARGNRIMEKLGVSPKSPLYPDCEDLETVWTQGLRSPAPLSDIASEAVLLHTFAYLGGKLSKFSENDQGRADLISMIQKYVDEHFSDPDFSLERLGNDLKYNKKYLSTVFKRHVGVGIVDYLHTVRIQHACTMLKQGFTSVSDVALRCGYPDAQYFSKVFKRRMNLSPREYMASVKSESTLPDLFE